MEKNMTTSRIKQQYESFPYPPRDPADERQRLVRTVGDDIAELNHHCFRGRQNFRNRFRCLVAGGGTGDAAIFLAEQLRDTDAEIVYLDISAASRQLAQQRAQVRGLNNIQWITASLLDIPRLGLGTFDYINCSGVLHHLPEPEAGLQSLAGAFRDDGALFLMLYGRYGRRGVYELQEILRLLLPDTLPFQDRIAETRALLQQLPPTNYFQRDRDRWESEIGSGGYGDAGLYDLLLHSQDRAYDVDAVYDLLEAGGLRLVDFTGPQKRRYRLRNLLSQPSSLRLCEKLDRRQQFSAAEKLSGDIIKHSFYAARNPDRGARFEDWANDPGLCIVLTAEMKDMHEQIHKAIVPNETFSITYALGNKQEIFRFPGNAINKMLFKYFDGCTPIAEMIGKVKTVAGSANPRFIESEIEKAFELLHSMGWAYLHSSSMPPGR